jgi:hypothetical protein
MAWTIFPRRPIRLAVKPPSALIWGGLARNSKALKRFVKLNTQVQLNEAWDKYSVVPTDSELHLFYLHRRPVMEVLDPLKFVRGFELLTEGQEVYLLYYIDEKVEKIQKLGIGGLSPRCQRWLRWSSVVRDAGFVGLLLLTDKEAVDNQQCAVVLPRTSYSSPGHRGSLIGAEESWSSDLPHFLERAIALGGTESNANYGQNELS